MISNKELPSGWTSSVQFRLSHEGQGFHICYQKHGLVMNKSVNEVKQMEALKWSPDFESNEQSVFHLTPVTARSEEPHFYIEQIAGDRHPRLVANSQSRPALTINEKDGYSKEQAALWKVFPSSE